jgi:hypothetical protein
MSKTKFTEEQINKMFERIGISRESLRQVLLKIGPPVHLKDPHIVEEWQSKVELNGVTTTGYCHRVTEAVHRMKLEPDGFEVHQKKDETGSGSHWFFKHENGEIIDLTADQFDDEGYDYDNSIRKKIPNISYDACAILIKFTIDREEGRFVYQDAIPLGYVRFADIEIDGKIFVMKQERASELKDIEQKIIKELKNKDRLTKLLSEII